MHAIPRSPSFSLMILFHRLAGGLGSCELTTRYGVLGRPLRVEKAFPIAHTTLSVRYTASPPNASHYDSIRCRIGYCAPGFLRTILEAFASFWYVSFPLLTAVPRRLLPLQSSLQTALVLHVTYGSLARFLRQSGLWAPTSQYRHLAYVYFMCGLETRQCPSSTRCLIALFWAFAGASQLQKSIEFSLSHLHTTWKRRQ